MLDNIRDKGNIRHHCADIHTAVRKPFFYISVSQIFLLSVSYMW
jgi:hypothetical protein